MTAAPVESELAELAAAAGLSWGGAPDESEAYAGASVRAGRYARLLPVACHPAADSDLLRRVVAAVHGYDWPRSGGRRAPEAGRRRKDPKHLGAAVLDAVAANANTPADLMGRLLGPCRDAALSNPALPLLPLEAPEFAAALPEGDAVALLRAADTPAPVVAALAAGAAGKIGGAARLHVVHAGECGPDRWEGEVREWWRTHAAEAAPGTDAALRQAEMAAVGLLPRWAAPDGVGLAARFAAAADPATPVGERERIVFEGATPWFIALAAALNPAPTPRRHAWVERAVSRVVSSHTNSLYYTGTPGAVRRLMQGRLPRDRAEVYRLCGAALCLLHLRDEPRHALPLCRFAALLDESAPVALLEKRAARSDWWWDRLAAALRLTGPEALAPLAQDASRFVRAAARARLADPARRFEW